MNCELQHTTRRWIGHPAREARRAFTLIELIVVIGIIVLLAALTIAVGPSVFGKSDERLVRTTLSLLDQAMSEWQSDAQKQLSWGVDGNPFANNRYDVQVNETPDVQLADALNRIARTDVARTILAQIDPDFLKGDLTASVITLTGAVDAWDTPIYMIHPGMIGNDYLKLYGPSAGSLDTDGTVFVDENIASELGLSANEAWEAIYGRCKNRRVLFVSAGPDGKFGSRAAGASEVERQATNDNLYSYPPELPQ